MINALLTFIFFYTTYFIFTPITLAQEGGVTGIGSGGDFDEMEFKNIYLNWIIEFESAFEQFHLNKDTTIHPQIFREVLDARIVWCPDKKYCPDGIPKVSGVNVNARNVWHIENGKSIPQIEINKKAWIKQMNMHKKNLLRIDTKYKKIYLRLLSNPSPKIHPSVKGSIPFQKINEPHLLLQEQQKILEERNKNEEIFYSLLPIRQFIIHEYLGLLEQKYEKLKSQNNELYRNYYYSDNNMERNVFDDSDRDGIDLNKYSLSNRLSQASYLFLNAIEIIKYHINFDVALSDISYQLKKEPKNNYIYLEEYYCKNPMEYSKKFIELGGYIDQKSKKGSTLLLEAASKQCRSYVEFLLNNNANPFEKYKGDGQNVLMATLLANFVVPYSTETIVRMLLRKGGADLAAQPCHLYIYNENEQNEHSPTTFTPLVAIEYLINDIYDEISRKSSQQNLNANVSDNSQIEKLELENRALYDHLEILRRIYDEIKKQ